MIGSLDNGSSKNRFGCKNSLISPNELNLKGSGLLLYGGKQRCRVIGNLMVGLDFRE